MGDCFDLSKQGHFFLFFSVCRKADGEGRARKSLFMCHMAGLRPALAGLRSAGKQYVDIVLGIRI